MKVGIVSFRRDEFDIWAQSVEDWQEEWSQKVVAVKLSNTVKILDYMWKGEIFFEETIIPGPSNPAQTLRKSLTEMLSGAEDSQQSKDLTEKLEDHYETGPSILIIIHEKNFPSPQDNTASVGSQKDLSNISRTFTYLEAREIIVLEDVGPREIITC